MTTARLFQDANTNGASDPVTHDGGSVEFTVWATDFDSGQITFEIRSEPGAPWIDLKKIDGTVQTITENDIVRTRELASGNEIRAVISGAGSSASSINVQMR